MARAKDLTRQLNAAEIFAALAELLVILPSIEADNDDAKASLQEFFNFIVNLLEDTEFTPNKLNLDIDGDSTLSNIVNANIKAGAGIALSKLASLTANRIARTDASGNLTAGTIPYNNLSGLETYQLTTFLMEKLTKSGNSILMGKDENQSVHRAEVSIANPVLSESGNYLITTVSADCDLRMPLIGSYTSEEILIIYDSQAAMYNVNVLANLLDDGFVDHDGNEYSKLSITSEKGYVLLKSPSVPLAGRWMILGGYRYTATV